MQVSRALIGLLLLASAMLDLSLGSAAFAGRPSHSTWPDFAEIIFVSLLVSQVTLIAGWSVLGQSGLFWRLLGITLATAAAGQALGRLLDPADHHLVPVWTVLLSAESALIAAAIIVARQRGLHLLAPGSPTQSLGLVQAKKPQFSLASLCSVMTFVAIALGAFRYALQNASAGFPQAGFWPVALVASAAMSVLTLTALWALLADGIRIVPVVLLAAVPPLVGTALWSTGEFGGWPVVLLFCVLQAFWLVTTLAVFRVAGFRLAVVRAHGDRHGT